MDSYSEVNLEYTKKDKIASSLKNDMPPVVTNNYVFS